MKIALVKPTVPESNSYRAYFQERERATPVWYEKMEGKYGKEIMTRRTYVSTHHRTSTGLMVLAGVLEEGGHKLKYFQQGMLAEQGLWRDRALSAYDAVVVTAPTQSYPEAARLAKEVKSKNPDTLTVIGGYHATYMDEESAKDFDVVVRGAGERTAEEVLDNFERGASWKDARGITYYDKGVLKRTPDRKVENFNDLPSPAFHLLDKNTRDNTRSELYTSRGCPYQCLFCSENCRALWKSMVYRSVDKVMEDVQKFEETFDYGYLFFKDSTFNADKKRMNEICSGLRENDFELTYCCFTRGDLSEKECVDTLSKTGFVSTFVGLETASDDMAAKMNKGETYAQQLRAFELFEKAGIFVNTSMLVGFPGETPQTIEENKRALEHIHSRFAYLDSWPRVFIPYPGTTVFKDLEGYGVKVLDWDFSHWVRGCKPIYELSNMTRDHIKQAALDLYAIGTKNAIRRAAQ